MLCPIGQSNEKPPLQALAKWGEHVTTTAALDCLHFCGKRENMAEEMISKERIDYTIDLLITMAVEEIAEDTGKSPKEILPEFYSSKTGKALTSEADRYGAMAHPILPNYTWTNSPKERI